MNPEGDTNPESSRGRVGIDLVPLGRIRALAERDSGEALRRMLSADEFGLSFTARGPDIPGIAGRIAAKEAVFKLFRVAGETLPWRTTEILRDPGGWPVVRLTGRSARIAREAGVGQVEVSITHEEPWAIAVAYCAAPRGADSRNTEGAKE